MPDSSDDAVRSTNDDAAGCKLSAVSLGYYSDPYVQWFAKLHRKQPLINRGYYARVRAVDALVKKFLDSIEKGVRSQIISLGAGSDTLFWRLAGANVLPATTTFVEVDFEQVTSKKCGVVRRHKALSDALQTGATPSYKNNGFEIHSERYHLVAADLRNTEEVGAKLKACGVEAESPTLFLAECVLIYMPPSDASALLRWIAADFSRAAFINYEQVKPDDAFGEVMVKNLEERQCPLLGIHSVPSLAAQEKRFLDAGWDGARAYTMLAVYNSIDSAEKARVSRLEIFDEFEEWDLMMSHYCLACAWKGGMSAWVQSAGLDNAAALCLK